MGDCKILFAGDIMPGGVLAYQDIFYTEELKKYLSEFDLRVATLEVAIGDDIPFDEVKMRGRQNIIYSKNESISKVVELDINIVSLANNHIFDLGIEGFDNTVKLLEKNGIKYCGAGRDIKEASRPVLIEKNGKTMAFLTYCDYEFPHIGYVPIATETCYGINPLNIDTAAAEIKHYKAICDYVIVLPHWGIEYNRFPTKKMKEYGQIMVDAGADLIVGSHAHIAQPSVKYKKKHIFYGLGNFLFPDFYMKPPRPMWYPPEDFDCKAMSTIYDYPFPIGQPMKRVWKEPSRIGLMVEAIVSNKIRISSRLSILSEDNTVSLYEDRKLERKLSVLGMMVSSPFYNGGHIPMVIANKLHQFKNSLKILLS